MSDKEFNKNNDERRRKGWIIRMGWDAQKTTSHDSFQSEE
jgi:hypothetical protein